MNINGQAERLRILVVAPTGADAFNLCGALVRDGLLAEACPGLAALATEMGRGCGALLLTQEALNDPGHPHLAAALHRQPPWSDVPLVLIVSGGMTPAADAEAIRVIGPRSNITQVERPLRAATLLSTVRAALRARERQYEVSNLLRERDDLLASLEQRVADRTAKLQALNRELEMFSYSVSHDLRAPLRALEGYARILCDDYAGVLPDEARHYADRIARNAEKMDRLTRDVLALSQLSQSELRVEAINLDVIVPEVIDQYPDLAAASPHITICSPLGLVRGHGPSLTQCFSNILQNALKFIPADRTPRIRIYCERVRDRVRVSVEDNGPGIAPVYHQRIFGMFERATSQDVPGTGIGLAIAKKAVERMGGMIGVVSAVGAGARFWIELAAADVPVPA